MTTFTLKLAGVICSAALVLALLMRLGGGLLPFHALAYMVSPEGIKLADVGRGLGGWLNMGVPITGSQLKWSPDGRKLAYLAPNTVDGLQNADIFLFDMDTWNSRNLTQSSANESTPLWSPDGGMLAYSTRPTVTTGEGYIPAGEMYIVDVETGQAVQNFTQPNYRDIVQAWSPDGRLLAFTRQSTISNTYQIQMRVVDVESGRRIPHLTKSDGVYFNSIWSPDGQWLVFQKLRGNTTAIYIADPQSGETRLLSDAAFTVPIWSPDSRWIAYTHLEAGVGGAREVLSIIDPVNGESRLMTHHNGSDSHATWALDSHHLIILSDRDGSVKLYLLNIETEAATLLSPDTYGLTETPVWSPDGEWLALTSVENLQSQIYLLDMEDQAMVHITDSGWASSPAWQP